MKKKRKVLKRKTHILLRKRLLTISIILALIIAVGSMIFFLSLQSSEVAFSLKANIIDQLGEEFANPTFVEDVTTILETRGFNVTYHNKTLDVNFFKSLAKNNYGIIILRGHSALRQDNSTVDLFTSEEYDSDDPDKYRSERENGLLTIGEYLYVPEKYYFAVTPLFIRNLEGRFSKSIIIAMGCWSLKPKCEQMAKAFFDKGAKAYVGWTNIVLPKDTDHETVRLLKMLLNENRSLNDAVIRTTMYNYTGTPDNDQIVEIHTKMRFYPPSAENLTISELIEDAKVSSATTALINSDNSFFLIVDAIRKPKGFKSKN